ncbi:MAG: D-sedoheptulose 7-phosphate isomerase [Bacteroidales bacterium]|jgi:D-sedoheptulose 7-phosphate isomerase|nr:D-sedoheptulose 7-phosphate isomerase [Bacteroidales bacterium]MDN5349288.1 D-sedoheptulose 7-phosphate isomerase [Bacteroidales bacterium]
MSIHDIIKASANLKQLMLEDTVLHQRLEKAIDLCVKTLKNDGKILFCGNGGSAADAQHLAAELSGRYYYDRPPLYAEALHVNTSYLTAVANDYDFDSVYSRMVEAAGRKGDILVGLSTSGNSTNVIKALEKANELGMHTIAFTGQTGGRMKELTNVLLNVPSTDTPRVQEGHILLGHILCQMIEEQIFPKT